jgi:hypothetical protein
MRSRQQRYYTNGVLLPLLFTYSVQSFITSPTFRNGNKHHLALLLSTTNTYSTPLAYQKVVSSMTSIRRKELWRSDCCRKKAVLGKTPTMLKADTGEEGVISIESLSSFAADPIEWVASYMADGVSSALQLEQQKQTTGRDENSEPIISKRIFDETSYSCDSFLGGAELDSEVVAVQIKTLVRVCLPAILLSLVGIISYPSFAMLLAGIIGDENHGAFAVLSQDASQYVQNILTSSGLMFSILVGYTYYFMYQQQEKVSNYVPQE